MAPEKYGELTVIRPEFNFDLKNVVQLRSLVVSGLKGSPKGIILDLSRVSIFDSLGHKTVQNLHASLRKAGGNLIVISGNAELREELQKASPNVEAVVSEAEAEAKARSLIAGEDFEEGGIDCPICGNDQFPFQVLRRQNFDPIWLKDSIFPALKSRVTDRIVDPRRQGIIVCNDCLMTSFYADDFNRRSGDEKKPAPFNKDIKDLLVKTTNRRRSLLQRAEIEKESMFDPAQSDRHLEMAFRLCVECLNSVSFDRSVNRSFESGLANLLVYHFSPTEKKEKESLQKADAGFAACIANPPGDQPEKVWQSYYYRMVLSFLLRKPEDSRALLEGFAGESQKAGDPAGFDFWYQRAMDQHRKSIQSIADRHAL